MGSSLGLFAEQLAADFLQNKGYAILARNWRKPWGELDIIAEKDKTVIFIEVKANRYAQEGFAAEVRANHDKLQKVVRTARTFLLERRYTPEQSWQVDVIAIVFDQQTRSAKLKHFKNIEV